MPLHQKSPRAGPRVRPARPDGRDARPGPASEGGQHSFLPGRALPAGQRRRIRGSAQFL